jgi:hypothetical protein
MTSVVPIEDQTATVTGGRPELGKARELLQPRTCH